jgi:hypothetical protein
MSRPRTRRSLRTATAVCTCLGALAGASASAGSPAEVVPGVTYERIATGGKVIHVTRVSPGPLITVRPALTGGAPTRRARLTDAMHARLGDGAVAGVNGDYFNLDGGYPSGLLLSSGELVSEPEPARSALLFPPSGVLTAARVELAGTWQAVDPVNPLTFPQRSFIGINRPSEQANETIVYTSRLGGLTPTGDRVDALITLDPPARIVPNTPITGTVQTIKQGGGSGVGPGKIVLTGAGLAGNDILADLAPGRRVTLTFAIPGIPAGTDFGLGGGPSLVENGVPLANVTEGFTPGQIGARTSRTAIGQAADGTVLLVTTEGPLQGSRGITMAEQAQLMASLGASTAVGMDGGGSAAMAIRDALVTPWRSERAISDAVIVSYAGVQLTPPAPLISPNGDGVDESTGTVARSARRGNVRITLAHANGTPIRTLYTGALGPGGRHIQLGRDTLKVRDGRYRVIARFTPSDGSARTDESRPLVVDRTVGFLKLRKIGRGGAAKLRVGFTLAKATKVTIVVQDTNGGDVKLLLRNRRIRAGKRGVTWNLRRAGKPLKPGIYIVGVSVSTPFAQPKLTARVRVTAPKKTPSPAPGA